MKKLVFRLAIFMVVIGLASLFDIYFENNPIELDEITSNSETNSNKLETVFFVNQVNTISIKTSIQKNPTRKLFVQSHNKFLQKYYQNRNYQVLKAEIQTQKTPLILSYHYLVFRNYFYTVPDDDPLS